MKQGLDCPYTDTGSAGYILLVPDMDIRLEIADRNPDEPTKQSLDFPYTDTGSTGYKYPVIDVIRMNRTKQSSGFSYTGTAGHAILSPAMDIRL